MSLDFWQLFPLLIATPAQVLFLVLYSIPAFGAGTWWRDFVGRALFTKSISLAFVLLTISISVLFMVFKDGVPIDWTYNWSTYLIYDRVLHVGYWLMTAAIYYQCGSIVKLRLQGRETERR